MRTALQGKPETSFSEPSGMVRVQVCALSGDLPTDECPHRRSELFLTGTEPDEYDSLYKLYELDAATGQLATDETPADRIVEQIYLTLPPEAQDWARERGIPAPPEAITAANETTAPLEISSPDEGTVYQLSALIPEESQQIRIRVVAQEPVTEITILLNEIPIAKLEAAPFHTLWTLVAGVHEVSAIGRTTVGEELRAEAVRFVVRPAGITEGPGGYSYCGSGKTTVNVVPVPTFESSQIRPPWLSTIDFTSERPNPVPTDPSLPTTSSERKNLSKTDACSSDGIPIPLSLTIKIS